MQRRGCSSGEVFVGLDPMNLVGARSIALAGAVAVGALSEALVCEPARADYYAFARTEHLSDATLRLTVGDTTVNINTGGFQGWFSTTSVFHIPGNSNYMVGEYNNTSYNDYFGFDLSSLPATATVSSAELVVDSGLISDKLNFILFGATQWIGQLQGGSNPDLYNELATGPEYSRTVISANTDPTALLTSSLNTLAVADINAAIQGRSMFAMSGHAALASGLLANSVPEPATWILMLAGFAGLGALAHRRAARRRPAAAAGRRSL